MATTEKTVPPQSVSEQGETFPAHRVILSGDAPTDPRPPHDGDDGWPNALTTHHHGGDEQRGRSPNTETKTSIILLHHSFYRIGGLNLPSS